MDGRCAQCQGELPPRPARMGPAPSYCSARCRRLREYELARAARRARAEARTRALWGDLYDDEFGGSDGAA